MKLLPAVLTYPQVQAAIKNKTSHLLLGNGFSIACDAVFSYGSLYEFVAPGLPEPVQKVFAHFGTTNFERVMTLLTDGAWMSDLYAGNASAGDAMRGDLEYVKGALLKAVADRHLGRPGDIHSARLGRCADFLKPYHNVFTLNYDLLLYWVEMHGLSVLGGRDGFRDSADDPDATHCVFSEHVKQHKGIFFVHGGLHLYVADGEVRKHTWAKSGKPLIELIQEGLQQGQYPLFVAEGEASRKREHILSNGYLEYCIGKLGRIQGPLVIFG